MLLPGWQSEGLGIDLGVDSRYTHSIWSDNIWLLASTIDQLSVMIRSLTHLMHFYGLHWKEGSLKVLPGGHVIPSSVTFEQGVTVQMNHIELEDIHIDFVQSTKALGININLQGSN